MSHDESRGVPDGDSTRQLMRGLAKKGEESSSHKEKTSEDDINQFVRKLQQKYALPAACQPANKLKEGQPKRRSLLRNVRTVKPLLRNVRPSDQHSEPKDIDWQQEH